MDTRFVTTRAVRRSGLRCGIALAAALCLLTVPGCRKRDRKTTDRAAGGREGAAEKYELQPGGAPQLGLSVNNLDRATVYQGWAVQIDLELRHPKVFAESEKADPIIVASRDGAWIEAVRLEMRDARDRTVDLGPSPVAQTEASIVLDAERMGTMRWWLDGEETKGLAEGEYSFVAILDTTKSDKRGAWRGIARSGPAIIRVQKESASLSEAQKEERRLLAAGVAESKGDRAAAMAEIEAILRERPESIAGLVRKSALLEKAGDKAKAFEAIAKALEIIRRDHPEAEFLGEIRTQYHRLSIAILKD